MRAAVKDQAELIAISYAERTDLTYGSDQEMEKAYRQYVSGWMFDSFGLQPALGRLFTENDDLKPGAHPYAVLSYDYWTRRFGRDPKVDRPHVPTWATDLFQIVGVAPEPFTGTETGTVTDIFLPTMMHPGVIHDDWSWIRTFVRLKPGVARSPFATGCRRVSSRPAGKSEGLHRHGPNSRLDNFLEQTLLLEPAAAGVSGMQKDYRRVAGGSRRAGGAGAADCVRQRRQPDDGSGRGAGARDGAARLDRRGTMAPGATGPGGKRLARVPRGGDRRAVRLVVRAVRGRQDQSAG